MKIKTIEEMKEYCERKKYFHRIPELVYYAYIIGLLDIKKLYIYWRCLELFGKRKSYQKPVKDYYFINSKIKIKKERIVTKKIYMYSNKVNKQKVVELCEDVGLKTARIYDYAKVQKVDELINQKDFFYIYCLGHMYDNDFFEIVFQERKRKINRYKIIGEYIISNPNAGEKTGYIEYHDDEDNVYFYKEDAVQKYFGSLKGKIVYYEENKNTVCEKIVKENKKTKYAEIEITYTGFKIIEYDVLYNKKVQNVLYNKIECEDKCLGTCKKIRDTLKRNPQLIYFIDENMSYYESRYLKKAIRYLSAFIENLYILK